MAKDDTASVITLHQPKRAKTGAERARAYREKKKATSLVAKEVVPALPVPTEHAAGAPTMLTPVTPHDIVKTATVTLRHVTASRPSRFKPNIFLALAALALAGVGTVQNGWFARSMGATPVAGTLFLILGVASDCVALVLPSVAARAWQARQRATALAGWMVWLATFAFALVSSIGFAATNISDVTMVRASRETPAVTAAQTALGDAMASRDQNAEAVLAATAGSASRRLSTGGRRWRPPSRPWRRRRTRRPWRSPSSSHGLPLVRSRRARTTSACPGSRCSAWCRNLAASWLWSRAHEVHG
jgi:hypothetical protein